MAYGSLISALKPNDIVQIQIEAHEKEQQGFTQIYKWEELKKNLPHCLKLALLTMIPHKSRKYLTILDLSFALIVAR